MLKRDGDVDTKRNHIYESLKCIFSGLDSLFLLKIADYICNVHFQVNEAWKMVRVLSVHHFSSQVLIIILSLLFHLPDLYKVYFIISWIRIRIPVYLRAGAGSYKNAIRINNIITSFIHKKKFCWTVTQFFETSPVFDILKK